MDLLLRNIYNACTFQLSEFEDSWEAYPPCMGSATMFVPQAARGDRGIVTRRYCRSGSTHTALLIPLAQPCLYILVAASLLFLSTLSPAL